MSWRGSVRTRKTWRSPPLRCEASLGETEARGEKVSLRESKQESGHFGGSFTFSLSLKGEG